MTIAEQLLQPDAYPHPASPTLIETHISLVFLTGEFAYKVKKPMDFGFLDFTTLERRRHFCHEELRLNRRFAPQLYLDVVEIRQTGDGRLHVGTDEGEVVEYAVRMAQFPDGIIAAERLATGHLAAATLSMFGRQLADIHASLPASEAGDIERAGIPSLWRDAMVQNFQQIRPYLRQGEDLQRLNRLEEWSHAAWKALEPTLWARYRDGLVRECHGDLHLGNIAVFDDGAVAFDCIEFNASFRWIDVMNEFAFLLMDCASRDHAGIGFVALNAALEVNADYAGLALLPSFLVYRSMVRAKVALLASPDPVSPDEPRYREWDRYSRLAEQWSQSRRPFVVLMCGVSGSGKSTLAAELVEALCAIRVRSDVERKRLFGLGITESSHAAGVTDIYSADASQRTFAVLEQHVRSVIDAGLPVIVDATFLHRRRRQQFRKLAAALSVPCLTLVCQASESVMRERLRQRAASGDDASEADEKIMVQQLAAVEWPDGEPDTLVVESDEGVRKAALDGLERALSAHGISLG